MSESGDLSCSLCRAKSENCTCPLCRVAGKHEWDHPTSLLYWDCDRCGGFAITREDAEDYLIRDKSRKRLHPARLSALTRERTLEKDKLPPYYIQFSKTEYPLAEGYYAIHVEELLQKWPATVPERLDRLLCNLAQISNHPGIGIKVEYSGWPVTFSENPEEPFFFLDSLKRAEHLTGSHVRAKHLTGCHVDTPLANGWWGAAYCKSMAEGR